MVYQLWAIFGVWWSSNRRALWQPLDFERRLKCLLTFELWSSGVFSRGKVSCTMNDLSEWFECSWCQCVVLIAAWDRGWSGKLIELNYTQQNINNNNHVDNFIRTKHNGSQKWKCSALNPHLNRWYATIQLEFLESKIFFDCPSSRESMGDHIDFFRPSSVPIWQLQSIVDLAQW